MSLLQSILDLNEECLLCIMSYVALRDLPSVSLTCTTMNRICDDSTLWKHFATQLNINTINVGEEGTSTVITWKECIHNLFMGIHSGVLFNHNPLQFIESMIGTYFPDALSVTDYIFTNTNLSKRRIGDYLMLRKQDIRVYKTTKTLVLPISSVSIEGKEEEEEDEDEEKEKEEIDDKIEDKLDEYPSKLPPKVVLEHFLNMILDEKPPRDDPHDDSPPKVDEALFVLFTHLEPPGRAQKIDTLCYRFAKLYFERFSHEVPVDSFEAVYVLMFSVIMLNTDAHHVEIKESISFNSFYDTTTSSMSDRCDLGEGIKNYLEGIYKRIHARPLHIGKKPLVEGKLFLRVTEKRWKLFGEAKPALKQVFVVMIDDQIIFYEDKMRKKVVDKVFGLRAPVKAKAVAEGVLFKAKKPRLFPFILYTIDKTSGAERVLFMLAADSEKKRQEWLQRAKELSEMVLYD